MTEVHKGWIAGFWRRIFAFVIDCWVLGLIGFFIGLIFDDVFVQLGGWGRLVGFIIGLLYFGVLNSAIGGGQTAGKRLLKVRVVNSSGQTISLGGSLLRYSVFAVPFLLNRAQFSIEFLDSFFLYLMSLIVFGGILSILYLYLFNRVTRQSLHDLALGTYVVNANVPAQEPGKIWKGHLVIVGLLCTAAIVVPVYTSSLVKEEPFIEMFTVQSTVAALPDIRHVEVSSGTSFINAKGGKSSSVAFVSVKVALSVNRIDDEDLAREIALIVLNEYPDALSKKAIRVVMVYGYDIGIWGASSSHYYDFDPLVLEGELSFQD
jgi:uncharacterized RDD family membrane protein YckC